MNTKQIIPKIKLLTILMSLVFSSQTFAQNKNFIDQAYLETSAKVDSLVIPDRIYLEILLKESDSKNKVSVEELEDKMVESLEAIGINIDEQLSIKDASTDFRKYFLKAKGIEKTKEYELLVYDGLSLGKVIQSLERNNISNIQLVKLEYSKIETLNLQLKSKAILKAKEQAEALVNPLGQTVKNAIHIVDRSFYANRANYYEVAEEEVVAFRKEQNEPKSLNIHKIMIISEVSVKFKLE